MGQWGNGAWDFLGPTMLSILCFPAPLLYCCPPSSNLHPRLLPSLLTPRVNALLKHPTAKTNGILIAVVMLVGTAVVIRNMGFAASPRILVNLVVSLMGIFASRSEQHLAQSRWRIEKLVATELEHVRRTLEDLIPREMIEATVSAISGGQRASPREHTASLSKSRATKRAVLLCMDLCEYTVFVSSMPSEKVAVHIHNLFSSFDLILLGPDAASNGLFKMDTIGDEYIAAAWLDDVDAPGAKERNARVCQCMQAVADSMIQALEAYNQEQQIQLQCRMGMDAGPVIAGMQGILQPRFHLLGPPVEGSAKLQTEAENNRIKISDVVRSML
jgi:class 3 adenylate cyclase